MAECGFGDVSCGVGNAVSGIVDDAIGNLAKSILEGMSQMVTTLSTFWVAMPTVNLATGDGVTPSPVVGFVNSGIGSWTLALAVLSVILGGTRMIWEQRGAPLKDLLRSLLTLTLVSGLGLAVISILVIAADAFSVSIIDRATDGKGFAEAMSLLVMMNQTGTGVFILIILGRVGLITSLVQIVLMIVRTGMLVILAGILPTTAAFTNTEMGRQWFQKAVGWTIAFILYKPAAAIVYAVAFQLMGSAASGGNVLLGPITGFALMIVALPALPALMRFVTPMVGAVASGTGGGAGATVGAVATGAVSMGRSGSGRGNASPTPASQPGQPGAAAQGSKGAGGGNGTAKPTPGSPGPGGAPGKGTTGGAGTAASAGAGAAPGAAKAAGPAGLVVAAGAQAASRVSRAAHQTAQDSSQHSTGHDSAQEGPSGSH
ncbi:hypothetical protein [Arthrobacter oryzae]|uniref:TrbL/VirB6 plasmid conjugal transfer protein n=1 Tax=Arthrobacter oryzae TaxID=409290 RepID=A0A3N0C294_9MICC|nr:hypothetical protein [Arthrobacter oryzae]RNL55955.1 hypothetical protein D7003_08985 [Arthrobacter oryzae]